MIKWVIECFFINFDIFICIMVFLLLNRKLVKVLYSLVLLIFVGFKNKKELIGWFGLESFVWLWWIVFVIIFIVFFWLIMCLCSMFFMCSNFFFLVLSIFDIGMLVCFESILVIFVFVILLCSRVIFCILVCVVRLSCFFSFGMWLYCSFDMWFKFFVWWVIFRFICVCLSVVLICCVLESVVFLVFYIFFNFV